MKRLFRTLAALFLLFHLPAWSQSSEGPAVRFLYPTGTTYKSDALVQVIVEFTNTSTRDRTFVTRWSLKLPVPSTLASVRMKAGEKRRIPLVLPRHLASQLYNLEVNDQSYSLDLQSTSQNSVVATLSPAEDKFDYLRSLKLEIDPNAAQPVATGNGEETQKPPKRIALNSLSNLEPSLLPESWALLSSLDTIIVYDLPSLSLSALQKQALLNWTLRGGRLVLVSDGNPTEYRDTPFEPYLPMEPDGVTTAGGIAQLTGRLHPEAKTLSSLEGRPLLVERPILNGKIFLLTAPLKELAPLSTAQAEALWTQVLPKLANYHNPNNYQSYNPTYSSYGSSYGNPVTGHLSDIPEMPRAQAGWLALYLLSYALIVGPINLSILRRRDKMLWSFVTVPAVALVFAGGAYLLNYLNRSSVPIFRELGMARFESSNSRGAGNSEGLFFSPSGQVYKLDCAPTAICHSSSGYSIDSRSFGIYSALPNGGLQASLELATWDVATLGTESVLELQRPIKGQWKGNRLTVDSPLSSAAGEAMLYHRSRGVTPVFTLKGGEQTENLAFSSNPTYDIFSAISSTSKEHHVRDTMLSTLSSGAAQSFKKDTVYLLFWSDALKVPIEMGAKTVHKSEYLVMVELES